MAKNNLRATRSKYDLNPKGEKHGYLSGVYKKVKSRRRMANVSRRKNR
jgi:hypothetical protein